MPLPTRIIVISTFGNEERAHVLAENTVTKKTFHAEVHKNQLHATIDELLKL